MAWTKTNDGSIVDQDGKVIFFSTRRFIEDIRIGKGLRLLAIECFDLKRRWRKLPGFDFEE